MSKRQGPIRIYWDSCVFLAWIKDESLPESVKKGIQQTLERAYANEVVIVTSAVTLTEVLQSKMTKEQRQKYQDVFRHPRLQLVDVDRRVATKAAVIREHYDTRTYDKKGSVLGGSFMSLGDSLHVATAIHFGVRELHTLDGSGKHKKRLDLLKLSGNVAGSRLSIVVPSFIEPPKPLEGPLVPTVGIQESLVLFPQEDHVTTKEPLAIAPPLEVLGGGDGHPQGEAGTRAEPSVSDFTPEAKRKAEGEVT